MKKVLIVDSTPFGQAPYIKTYTDSFDKMGIPWDIFVWDKNQNLNDITYKDHIFTSYRIMHLKGKEKYYDFYKISRDILKIIKREGISHLVIVNSIWAILLYKCLRNYTNRFILDIRDYKIEKKTIIQFLLKDIINRSYCTFISSEGFQDFLPPSQHIHVIHNLDTNHMKIRVAEKVPTDINKIKIGFVGYVRYDAPNRWLIKQLRNHSDTEIHYYGGFSRYCNFHKEKNLIGNNVFFHGPYNNDDKSEIYNDIDFINALYSQDYSSRIALPNCECQPKSESLAHEFLSHSCS